MAFPSRLGASLFVFFLVVCSVVAQSGGFTQCQDVLVESVKVTPAQARTICASCSSLLPLNQCIACYRESKHLLAALKCPTSVKANARQLDFTIVLGDKALNKKPDVQANVGGV